MNALPESRTLRIEPTKNGNGLFNVVSKTALQSVYDDNTKELLYEIPCIMCFNYTAECAISWIELASKHGN